MFGIRPLSSSMLQTLMEIHEREILGQDLCDQTTKNVRGLYSRRLIDTCNCKSKEGKPYVGFYITEAGKQYLQHITRHMSESQMNIESI